MDDGRGNRKRRARPIDGEDHQTTNRRRQTNHIVTNEPLNDGAQAADDDGVSLSLSLGLTPFSSQIPPPTTATLRLESPSPIPPPMLTGWSSPHDFMARLASSHSYLVTSPAYLASSSLTPMQPPLSFLPSLDSIPSPPRSSIPVMVIPVASEDAESRRSYRSQPSDYTIPQPFPWATNKPGSIHNLEYLESKQITTITGEVKCKHCEKVSEVSYNLRERFTEVVNIFVKWKRFMRERAPPIWTNPGWLRCDSCGRDKAVKPVIADRKSKINWLFLLLGQTLGHCTLDQLKNFCKHSKNHRTGAKDRVLYLTYLGLCKMLEPNRELFSDSFRR